MIQLESAAKKWLRENGGDLFLCPHQPGNLLISRRFCSERYRSSQRLKGNGFWFDDRAIYNLRASLLKCRTCSIGKKWGKSRESRSSAAGTKSKTLRFPSP